MAGGHADVAGDAVILDGVESLVERIRSCRAASDARLMVALAGPPATGKSTLAAALAARIDDSLVVPMDGFHLDNALLDAHGTRAVKGAPHTFDADGLAATLRRIRADDGTVHVALFDRGADLSRAAAASVLPVHRTIIVEGNYLLLDEAPWRSLEPLFDLTVLIETDLAELERRLIQRWLDHGLDARAAGERAESNDLPNGRLVMAQSRMPDCRFRA